MIVKDEAKVIQRCLESAKPYISHWVICDTGSSDETIEIISRTLSGIPGALYKDTWKDFGHNRSLAVKRAKGTADYLLLLDADMTVEMTGGPTDADAYLVPYTGSLSYSQKLLVSGNLDWRYEGSTHEYITTDAPCTQDHADFIKVTHHADGASRDGKYQRDLDLLLKDWEKEKLPRTAFYIAQSYLGLDKFRDAAHWYEYRVSMRGWDEEVFYSQYKVGQCLKDSAWPQAADAFIKAWEKRPTRAEPLYELAKGYRQRGLYQAAYAFASIGCKIQKPNDVLFVHSEVYEWGCMFEYAIAAYYVGNYSGAYAAATMVASSNAPANIIEQNDKNLEFIKAKL